MIFITAVKISVFWKCFYYLFVSLGNNWVQLQLRSSSSYNEGCNTRLPCVGCLDSFPRVLKRRSHILKQREAKSLLNWRGAANGFPTKPGKVGIFLARVRHATVIQIRFNYSARGPRLLYGHICCCAAGTFKLGLFSAQVHAAYNLTTHCVFATHKTKSSGRISPNSQGDKKINTLPTCS